ncbi:LPS-assembly protein LptD [Rhizobium leguminosarum]|uniref:LPS-assembly protein LptD n=1 Tax=Rhizobium leguminosarum TaxID=384 RepID=UPI001FEE07DD|nr:LPS-assembly protein LptD [Rhizobium leguminosarum]
MSMTDVIFESESLSLELGFLELDPNDHRSTRWSVRLSIKHSTGCFSYLATDVWFDTGVWDEFTTGLSSQEPKILRLVDMSENFRFVIERTATSFETTIQVLEPIISQGMIRLEARLEGDLDGPLLRSLRGSFAACPKFW